MSIERDDYYMNYGLLLVSASLLKDRLELGLFDDLPRSAKDIIFHTEMLKSSVFNLPSGHDLKKGLSIAFMAVVNAWVYTSEIDNLNDYYLLQARDEIKSCARVLLSLSKM